MATYTLRPLAGAMRTTLSVAWVLARYTLRPLAGAMRTGDQALTADQAAILLRPLAGAMRTRAAL